MTTVAQIADGVAEELGVKTAEIALQPGDFQVILDRLNDLGTEWSDIGLTPAFQEVANDTDPVAIDRNAVSAFKFTLAIRCAPAFQRAVTPALAENAKTTLATLRASVNHIGPVDFPDTLPTGSGNDCPDSFNTERFFEESQTENF